MTKEQIQAYIDGAIEMRLRQMKSVRPLTITRKEVMSAIGRGAYEKAVREGKLNPIKDSGPNSKVRFRYTEVEQYLEMAAGA